MLSLFAQAQQWFHLSASLETTLYTVKASRNGGLKHYFSPEFLRALGKGQQKAAFQRRPLSEEGIAGTEYTGTSFRSLEPWNQAPLLPASASNSHLQSQTRSPTGALVAPGRGPGPRCQVPGARTQEPRTQEPTASPQRFKPGAGGGALC